MTRIISEGKQVTKQMRLCQAGHLFHRPWGVSANKDGYVIQPVTVLFLGLSHATLASLHDKAVAIGPRLNKVGVAFCNTDACVLANQPHPIK